MRPLTPRPVPHLEPQAITFNEYEAFTPEKLELIAGYLIDGPNDHEQRRDLLLLLLANEGLVEAVRLAPEARWREAIRRVYGDGGA